jgi:CBS domain-containing protein
MWKDISVLSRGTRLAPCAAWEDRAMNIAEVMNWDVIAVTPGTSIQEAARLIVSHGVSGLPVVDDDGMVLGMVSDGDLVVRRRPRRALPGGMMCFAATTPPSATSASPATSRSPR